MAAWGSPIEVNNIAVFIRSSDLTKALPKRKNNPVQAYLEECRKNRAIEQALK